MRSVLQNIAVNNRSNMFVYKENNSGHVFYLRLVEAAGVSKMAPDDNQLSTSSYS